MYLESNLLVTSCSLDGDVESVGLGIVGDIVDVAEESNVCWVDVGEIGGVDGELGKDLVQSVTGDSSTHGEVIVGLSSEDTSAGLELSWCGGGEGCKSKSDES